MRLTKIRRCGHRRDRGGHQHARPGIGQDVAQFHNGVGRVHRNHHQTGLQRSQVDGEEVGRGGCLQGDAITRLEAVGGQADRELRHRRIELRPGQANGRIYDSGLLSAGRGSPPNQVAD